MCEDFWMMRLVRVFPTLIMEPTVQLCTLGPTGGPWQSCTVGSIISVGNTLTRRIIQKSSHILEIQTVKLALANGV
jgi:hypothetical protein